MSKKRKFNFSFKIKRDKLPKIFAIIFAMIPVIEILVIVTFYLLGPQQGMSDWLQDSSYFVVTVMLGVLVCHLGLAQVMYVKEKYARIMIISTIVGVVAIFPLSTIYQAVYGP